MYRKDRCERHAELLSDLGRELGAPARAPQLLDCWTDLGLVVQEWVPGTPLAGWTELAMDADRLGRLGGALARLHAVRLPQAPVMDLAAHLRRTCQAGGAALALERPALGQRALELERRILDAERQLLLTPSTCHGDFGPRQAFATADAIWFVDLDGLCTSDAAFDLAHVVVGLETYLGVQAAAPLDRFVDGYRAAGGRIQPAALAVHTAFGDLRRAIVLGRKQPVGWESDCARALERGHARW
jgi:Ser/Thr protein kinase RdoA (MazF antagonist)